MRDNANTFFGNPPETLEYKLKLADDSEPELPRGQVITTRNGSEKVEYTLRGKSLINGAGALLSDVTDSRE